MLLQASMPAGWFWLDERDTDRRARGGRLSHAPVQFGPVVLTAALLLSPGTIQAQGVVRVDRPPRPDQSRVFVDVNVAGQSSSVSGSREFTSRFVRFAETGSMGADYPAPRSGLSPLVDLAGTFMLKRFLGVGVSYNRVTYDDNVGVSATIPHPTVFGFPASDSGTTDRALERVEATTGVFMTLVLVRTDQLQVRVLGGPSFFSYRADMVQDVSYAQTATPLMPQHSITIEGFTSATARGNAVGLHAGGDVAYFFSKLFGVTAGVRFSDGIVTLDREPLSGVSQQIRVGGTLVFLGARVRFGG
jgi:hypothetical protein